MNEGKIKSFLRKTKIIAAFSIFQQFRYDRKHKKKESPNRWYFKFLPIKHNKIVFDNFLGKGYGDNPKAIAEEIIQQGLKWDLVWLTERLVEMPEQIRQVEYGSSEAMKELATAKLWVFNCRNVKHPKKRRMQKYLQTWHGVNIPLKKVEGMVDSLSLDYIEKAKYDGRICDYVLSCCKAQTYLLNNYFWLSPNVKILEYGCPSNDILFDKPKLVKYKEKILKYYNINKKTRIILYMPTFRDDFSDIGLDIDFTNVINAFEKRFSTSFVLLFRLHPNVASVLKLHVKDNRVIDVTGYPEATELFAVADFGVSDYSNGLILGFPRIRKPSFIYASDYKQYKEKRGLTEYYEKLPLNINTNNQELIDSVLEYEEKEYFEKWNIFFNNEESYDDGFATKRTVEFIRQII